MSNPTDKSTLPKLPNWIVWIGLFGIVNFVVGCWSLLPPRGVVYFWFAEFFSHMILPSLIFFPVSIIIVVLWLSRFLEESAVKVIMLIVGITVSACAFMPAFGTVVFISNLHVIGKVKQNGHYYYLVSYANDEIVTDYAICESDAIGFSGQCQDIASSLGNNQAKIYIEEKTNLVTVESERPAFIWTNSVPPKCGVVREENMVDWFAVGCEP
ncbi:MAG: hypothetical protein H6667_01795 [Ardenticatenaceae bacterium]|nr:hypothetical protein [Ardenticatenaceae bacterium]